MRKVTINGTELLEDGTVVLESTNGTGALLGKTSNVSVDFENGKIIIDNICNEVIDADIVSQAIKYYANKIEDNQRENQKKPTVAMKKKYHSEEYSYSEIKHDNDSLCLSCLADIEVELSQYVEYYVDRASIDYDVYYGELLRLITFYHNNSQKLLYFKASQSLQSIEDGGEVPDDEIYPTLRASQDLYWFKFEDDEISLSISTIDQKHIFYCGVLLRELCELTGKRPNIIFMFEKRYVPEAMREDYELIKLELSGVPYYENIEPVTILQTDYKSFPIHLFDDIELGTVSGYVQGDYGATTPRLINNASLFIDWTRMCNPNKVEAHTYHYYTYSGYGVDANSIPLFSIGVNSDGKKVLTTRVSITMEYEGYFCEEMDRLYKIINSLYYDKWEQVEAIDEDGTTNTFWTCGGYHYYNVVPNKSTQKPLFDTIYNDFAIYSPKETVECFVDAQEVNYAEYYSLSKIQCHFSDDEYVESIVDKVVTIETLPTEEISSYDFIHAIKNGVTEVNTANVTYSAGSSYSGSYKNYNSNVNAPSVSFKDKVSFPIFSNGSISNINTEGGYDISPIQQVTPDATVNDDTTYASLLEHYLIVEALDNEAELIISTILEQIQTSQDINTFEYFDFAESSVTTQYGTVDGGFIVDRLFSFEEDYDNISGLVDENGEPEDGAVAVVKTDAIEIITANLKSGTQTKISDIYEYAFPKDYDENQYVKYNITPNADGTISIDWDNQSNIDPMFFSVGDKKILLGGV